MLVMGELSCAGEGGRERKEEKKRLWGGWVGGGEGKEDPMWKFMCDLRRVKKEAYNNMEQFYLVLKHYGPVWFISI